MANYIVPEEKLTSIANSIRLKTGKSNGITVDNMPDEIKKISSSGSDIIFNIHDSTTDVANEYIEPDGTIKGYTGWSRSDYIEINGNVNTVICPNSNSGYCCFFDTDKNWVSRLTLPIYSIPETAKYMIVSASTYDLTKMKLYLANLQ